ncbi:MAG: hypothetical protein AAF636_01140 [Pseudomonadota bacterium]
MSNKLRQPAVPIDLTKLPQFAPQPRRWPWVVAAAAVLCVAVAATALLLENINRARHATLSQEVLPVSEPEFVARVEQALPVLPPFKISIGDAPVSQQLRVPLRITDQSADHLDLKARVHQALDAFGVTSEAAEAMAPSLVRTLAQGQSDAFIEAVLNAAYNRGDFRLPPSLVTPTGEVETLRILGALLAQPPR